MILYAKNLHGLLEFTNKRALFDFLLDNSDYKGLYVVNIEKEKGKRSLGFNAYLWGVVYKLISEHTGHTAQELHEIYTRMFIPPKFITYKGKEIKVPSGTSGMDTATFWTYVDRVIAEGASMGVVIPPPENKEEFKVEVAYPENNLKTPW
jgi:hypothetical protein